MMKRYIFQLFSLLLLLFLFSCKEDVINDVSNHRQIVVTATMPGMGSNVDGNSASPRKVKLSQRDGTLNLIARWKDGDEIHLFVRQDNNFYMLADSKVSNISSDGKTCSFSMQLPSEVDPGRLYEILGLCDVEGIVVDDVIDFVAAKSQLRRVSWNNDNDTFAPIWFHTTGNDAGIRVNFQHLGTYEVLHVKNSSSSAISFRHCGFDVQNPWFKYYDSSHLDENYDPTQYVTEPGDEDSNTASIAAGATGRILSWYMPSGAKLNEAKLIANINGKSVTSSNTKSSSINIQRGRVYHMYATWDGKQLKFVDGDDNEHGSAESETFTVNGVSFNMVAVEGGTFMMGSEDDDPDAGGIYSDEKPQHKVYVSSFAIGETEVTQELWKTIMNSNPSEFKGEKLPVENVSWDDCQVFISKLNNLTGRQFRLPTEAEWEYAARGGKYSKGYRYSGGNDVDVVAWNWENCNGSTQIVGTKPANELGLYDMSGNVFEWCLDWYDHNYYEYSPLNNPCNTEKTSEYRIHRGGNIEYIKKDLRVAMRGDYVNELSNRLCGFRLVLEGGGASGNQEGGTGTGTGTGGDNSGSGSSGRGKERK